MAVFRYRMQNILNLKSKLEEQERLAFAQAGAALDREQKKLAGLEEKKQEYEQILRTEMSASLNVKEISRLQEGVATMKWHIEEQTKRVKRCEDQLEEERVRLTEAMKERKIQEKLRENAFEIFKKEEEQKEQKNVDELIAYQYGEAGMQEKQSIREGSAEYGKKE